MRFLKMLNLSQLLNYHININEEIYIEEIIFYYCYLYFNYWLQQKNKNSSSELEVENPVKQLVLKSNLLSEELNDKNILKIIAEEKELLKKERKVCGSNQFIGIFNYHTLATACYYADNMKKCDYYMKKALKINQETYQYRFIEANLHSTYALYFESEDLKKALSHENKCIEILEEWQTKDHYDLLKSYENRGNIYYSSNDIFKAIQDYKTVMERCTMDHEMLPVSYYNLGDAYNHLFESDKAIESYTRAYYLWKIEGWGDLNSNIKDKLKQLYYSKNINIDFDIWFQEMLNKAEEDLKVSSEGQKD